MFLTVPQSSSVLVYQSATSSPPLISDHRFERYPSTPQRALTTRDTLSRTLETPVLFLPSVRKCILGVHRLDPQPEVCLSLFSPSLPDLSLAATLCNAGHRTRATNQSQRHSPNEVPPHDQPCHPSPYVNYSRRSRGRVSLQSGDKAIVAQCGVCSPVRPTSIPFPIPRLYPLYLTLCPSTFALLCQYLPSVLWPTKTSHHT